MSLAHELESAVGYDAVHVHVDNASEFQVTRTEEIEPAHYTTQSYILPPVGAQTPQADYNQAEVPVQLLQLDPLRKRAVLSVNGTGSCYICSSQAQAQSLQFSSNQTADAGALVTAPFAFTAEATGPLWAVLASTPVPVTPAVPATGVAQENVNPYPVQVVIGANGATITNVSVNGVTVGTGAGTYVVPAFGEISIAYSVATPVWTWTDATPSNITVGVLQERRNAV
jgi:hypothetical protein